MNEKFKSDVKNYLNSLYDTTTEKVETSYSGQQPKESDLIQDEKNKPSEGEEEKKYIEETVENNSKSYDRKKVLIFVIKFLIKRIIDCGF